MNPYVRRNQDSSKEYEIQIHKKIFKKPNTLENFYYDNFNQEKQNQYELEKKQYKVSKNIINKLNNYREDF